MSHFPPATLDDAFLTIKAYKETIPPRFPVTSRAEADALSLVWINGLLVSDDYILWFPMHELGVWILELRRCWSDVSPASPDRIRSANFAKVARYIRRPNNSIRSIQSCLLMAVLLRYHALSPDWYLTTALTRLKDQKEPSKKVTMLWLSMFYLNLEHATAHSLLAAAPLLRIQVVPDAEFLCSNFGTTFAELQKVYLHGLEDCLWRPWTFKELFTYVCEMSEKVRVYDKGLMDYIGVQIARANIFVHGYANQRGEASAHETYLKIAQKLEASDRVRSIYQEGQSLLELSDRLDRKTWISLSTETIKFLSVFRSLSSDIELLYSLLQVHRDYSETPFPSIEWKDFTQPPASTTSSMTIEDFSGNLLSDLP
ncbi:hypothetical protein B0T10DRAFT_501389 [Thelonectria olida]|uniref:Uncharacterized protein n=1 Tax=Thelonectria olida TaxID=1576542 RepID=A0A9P9AJV9_9HYPO|nr:hypothetical protein B0T10DRAFT_501389 [Thelonectria olida]